MLWFMGQLALDMLGLLIISALQRLARSTLQPLYTELGSTFRIGTRSAGSASGAVASRTAAILCLLELLQSVS